MEFKTQKQRPRLHRRHNQDITTANTRHSTTSMAKSYESHSKSRRNTAPDHALHHHDPECTTDRHELRNARAQEGDTIALPPDIHSICMNEPAPSSRIDCTSIYKFRAPHGHVASSTIIDSLLKALPRTTATHLSRKRQQSQHQHKQTQPSVSTTTSTTHTQDASTSTATSHSHSASSQTINSCALQHTSTRTITGAVYLVGPEAATSGGEHTPSGGQDTPITSLDMNESAASVPDEYNTTPTATERPLTASHGAPPRPTTTSTPTYSDAGFTGPAKTSTLHAGAHPLRSDIIYKESFDIIDKAHLLPLGTTAPIPTEPSTREGKQQLLCTRSSPRPLTVSPMEPTAIWT